MARKAEFGITITSKDETSKATQSAAKNTADLAKKTEALKKGVASMPEKFSKTAGAMTLVGGAAGSMGGEMASSATRVADMAGLIATGGPLGIALAAGTIAIAAFAFAWQAMQAPAEAAKKEIANINKAMQASKVGLATMQKGIKELQDELRNWGKTSREVRVGILDDLIAGSEAHIRSVEASSAAMNIRTQELFLMRQITADVAIAQIKMADSMVLSAKAANEANKTEREAIGVLQDRAKQDERRAIRSVEIEREVNEAKKQADDLNKSRLKRQEETLKRIADLKKQIASDNLNREIKLTNDKIDLDEKNAASAKLAAEQSAASWKANAESIGQSVGQSVADVASGAQTMEEAMKGAALSSLQTIIQTVISSVMARAVEAGAGAASAMAPIPIVGPALAAAAMASILGMVMGLLSSIPKAAHGGLVTGGIPGVDSVMIMAQQGELIIPKKDVDRARQGGMSQGKTIIINRMWMPNMADEMKMSRRQLRSRARLANQGMLPQGV